LEKHVFATPLGEVWTWSEPDALAVQGSGGERPLVLFVNGAFSIARPRSFELPGLLPEAVVMNAHLPANHCPAIIGASVGAYAAAYDAALDQIGRPAIVIGASIGALVALGMRSPLIEGRVLCEPVLRTDNLWCLVPDFRRRLGESPDDAGLADFLWTVFGISATEHVNRDYRHLLERLDGPAYAVFGGEPLLPPRPFTELPSLVDEPERDLLRAHPLVRTEVIETVGHNVSGRAITFIRTYTRNLLNGWTTAV